MTQTARILPGCGFWRTDRYPIGGSFQRAARDGNGLAITDVVELPRPDSGRATHEGRLAEAYADMPVGCRIAFSSHIAEFGTQEQTT